MPLRDPNIADEQNRDNLTGLDADIRSVQAAARKRLTAVEADVASLRTSYRTIEFAGGDIGAGQATATLFFLRDGSTQATGTNIAAGKAPHWFYFDDADYLIAGKTLTMRLRAQVFTNATAPTSTFTFGLYPISSVAGGAGVGTITMGTVVSGSTVAFAAPSASTRHQDNSGNFTIPADGHYCIGVVVSVGATAANSNTMLSAQLQVSNS